MNTVSRTNHTSVANRLLLLYGLLLILNQICIIWDWETGRFVSKCLLMPALLTYFLYAGSGVPAKQKGLIVAALLASWAGDVFLLFDSIDSLYFMLGLGSFLLAHIFYCIYFAGGYRKIAWTLRVCILLLVAIYGGLLLYILSPYLGKLVWPVRVYALVISLMLLLALYVHVSYRNRASMLLALGACFFIISDSVLAINKFYAAFPFAGVAVMSTYGIAQVFIVSGALRLPVIEEKR